MESEKTPRNTGFLFLETKTAVLYEALATMKDGVDDVNYNFSKSSNWDEVILIPASVKWFLKEGAGSFLFPAFDFLASKNFHQIPKTK